MPIVGEKVYKLEAFRLLVFELKKYFAVTRRELGIYIRILFYVCDLVSQLSVLRNKDIDETPFDSFFVSFSF